MKQEMIDACCGAGLFSKGLAQAGFHPLFGIDFNRLARQAYSANHGGCPVDDSDLLNVSIADVLSARRVPTDWDGLVPCSSPCQDYSLAGVQKMDNERRKLAFIPCDFARELPKATILFENLKAFKPGTAMRKRYEEAGKVPEYDEMLRRMADLGRKPFEFFLDGADWGCARRSRIFVIFPPAGFKGTFQVPIGTGRMTIRQQIGEGSGFIDKDPESAKIQALEAVLYPGIGPGENYTASRLGRKYMRIKEGSGHDMTNRSNFLRRPSWDQIPPCVTVLASGRCYRIAGIHPQETRYFSIGERKRFLGAKQNFILCGSVVERQKQIGNGVCIPVAEALGREILKANGIQVPFQRHPELCKPMDTIEQLAA